jgi:hypothetical protein
MGDNANKNWEWHNNEVGGGYAAPGVVRQRQAGGDTGKIVDMTKPVVAVPTDSESSKKQKKESSAEERREKSDRHKKKRKKNKDDSSRRSRATDSPGFNPLLQLFASQISDTTRHFSVE